MMETSGGAPEARFWFIYLLIKTVFVMFLVALLSGRGAEVLYQNF
jgi:hypothetical protein